MSEVEEESGTHPSKASCVMGSLWSSVWSSRRAVAFSSSSRAEKTLCETGTTAFLSRTGGCGSSSARRGALEAKRAATAARHLSRRASICTVVVDERREDEVRCAGRGGGSDEVEVEVPSMAGAGGVEGLEVSCACSAAVAVMQLVGQGALAGGCGRESSGRRTTRSRCRGAGVAAQVGVGRPRRAASRVSSQPRRLWCASGRERDARG